MTRRSPRVSAGETATTPGSGGCWGGNPRSPWKRVWPGPTGGSGSNSSRRGGSRKRCSDSVPPGGTETPGRRRAGALEVNDGGEMFAGVPLAKVAEYWDRRPCNIRHSPKDIGTRAYFDEVEARKYFVEPYDVTSSWGVFHHTPHPPRVIDQIRRYVRPGTTVKLMVYHRRSWKVLGILLGRGRGRFWRLDELVARHSEAETGCPVTYTYRPRDVAAMLAGFRIREMWVDHIFPYRIADYVQYRYVKAWPFRPMPAPAFRWPERRFGWHLRVTAEVPEGIQSRGTNSRTDLMGAHR